MITKKHNSEIDWMAYRRGKVSGTVLGDIIVKRGTVKKIAFYDLIAQRLGIPADDENAMVRGKRLQAEAIERFTKETGKPVNTELITWEREDNPNMMISPDGVIDETSAVEVKCLSSSRHIEALLTQAIPKDYEYQVLQYFIISDKLEKLYFVFYDNRVLAKPFFYIEVKRETLAEDIKTYTEYQKNILEEVNQAVLSLSNF